MTYRQPSAPPLPQWLKPGIWVRNKLSPYMGRAFVLFVDEGESKGGFQYHLEKPWKAHVRDQGWHTGGTTFAAGVEHWEPCEAPLSDRARTSHTCPQCGTKFIEATLSEREWDGTDFATPPNTASDK